MASLTKDSKGRSPFWIACYTAADGRQLKKSTKQKDRKQALEVCLALERAEAMARQGTLTETRTRELLAEVLERATGESLPFYSTEAWLRGWLSGKEIAKSERTHSIYKHAVESFLTHLGGKAKVNLAALAVADVARFRDSQIATGKAAKTVRLVVSVLRTALNAAKRQGILSHNPVEAVELPALPKPEDGGDSQRKPFSPEQVEALLKAASPEWRGAILAGYFTGARLTDVANLTWNAIDLPARLAVFRPKKTGRTLTIPLHPMLEAHLLEMSAPHSGKAQLFPSLAGRTASGLGKLFLKIMKRAGVQGELIHGPKSGAGRELRTLSFHSLRHSFNSQLANAGVAQEIRQIFTGHSTTEMNEHYTHRELETFRQAIAVIPGIGRKAAK